MGNLGKMTVANLGRQHHRSLDSCSKRSQEYLYSFNVIIYYFIPSILLKLVVYVFNLILLMFSYSLNSMTILTPYVILMRGQHSSSHITLTCYAFIEHKDGEKIIDHNEMVSYDMMGVTFIVAHTSPYYDP